MEEIRRIENPTIDEKPKEKKSKCCTFCNKEGHKYNDCTDPEMQVLIQDVKKRVEICENRDDLYKFLTRGLTRKTLRIMANHFKISTKLSKPELVAALTQPFIDGQVKQYINNFRKIEDLMEQHPNKPLEEIITTIVLDIIRQEQIIGTPNNDVVDIVFDWLESYYNGQSPNIQRRIYNGFNLALQQININNNGLSPINELRRWKVESLLLCLETRDELNKKTECPICLEEVKTINILKTNCNHEFCGECIMKKLETDRSRCAPNCPMCRTDIKTMEIKCPEIFNEFCEKYSK
jgi:Ring finger domain